MLSRCTKLVKVTEFQLSHFKCPKYWSFSFSISPFNEYSGLNSFQMEWLDILAVQGTLKSLLQHYNLKASIFRCAAFCTVPHSHPYMTNGKTIAWMRQIDVGKIMSLLFNMLSRSVIVFFQTANFNNTKPQLLSVKFSHSVKSDSETPWTAA